MKASKFAHQRPEGPREFVDLHMHSTFSDGMLPVKDLIDYCVEQGLTAIAVTDHDNIDSFEEGRDYAGSRGLEFIPGVEISSSIGGSDIHILGYMFDPTHLRLNRTLIELRERRVERAKAILERLDRRGMNLNYERVAARAQGGSVGRAHIAAQLVEEEYVSTFQDAFNLYLGNDADLMSDLDTVKLSPADAIALILEAGGVPVLAHPCKTNRDDLLDMLVECGLMGIETYCHGLSRANCEKYRSFAQKRNLICTGGADFHVKRPDGRNAPGSLRIPYKVLSLIKELGKSRA